jgi:hypothetical protein
MLKRHPKQARRGVILIVVLMLITLFAIIGVSFVLYADSEAASARLDRESRTLTRPDLDPQQALALILGQVIYGVDDENGVYSGIRGYDLARGVYGNNNVYDTSTGQGRYFAMGNTAAFTGNGRLHYTYGAPTKTYPIPTWLQGVDDWALVNYTYFPTDGFLRDPDRYGVRFGQRGSGVENRPQYLASSGVPYTYPDHNNMAVAIIRPSDGAVLAQSFHRPWMGFGSLDPNTGYNATTGYTYWTQPSTGVGGDPTLKYKVLRPRKAEHPNFPLPEDAGGDVKNFLGGPGYYDPVTQKFCNNDSFWIDPGLNPMTGSDGKMFKVMAAMLIADLGGNLDVNAHGNIRQSTNGVLSHTSDQGFGPWEVNLSLLLNATTTPTGTTKEYPNLFVGRQNTAGNATEVQGKYGVDLANPGNTPTPVAQNPALPGYTPHYYAQVNFDGDQTTNNPQQYSTTLTNTNTSPTFPSTYQNGSNAERTNHPLGFNPVRGFPYLPWQVASNSKYNLVFPASDLERLFRFNDTDGPSWASQLERLLPMNFNDPTNALLCAKRRLMVTTHSGDRNAPGVSPYIYFNPATLANLSGPMVTPGTPATIQPPQGPAIPFPQLGPPPTSPTIIGIGDIGNGEFSGDWRTTLAQYVLKGGAAVTNTTTGQRLPLAALKRIDLNRPLRNYPLGNVVNPAANPPQFGPQVQSTYTIRFDDPNAAKAMGATLVQVQQEFLWAQQDRQVFANDIYRTLLALTGVPSAADPANPTDTELAYRRWLAQLAVNIVDFIDEDDISTPFNFYNADDGLDPSRIGDLSNDATLKAAQVPRFWVFGTELPHVVLNEALAETPDTTQINQQVKLWLELYNPYQNPAPTTQQQDQWAVPLYIPVGGSGGTDYAPYRIEVYNNGIAPGTVNDNVLGVGVQTVAPNTNPILFLDAADFKTTPAQMDGTAITPPTGTSGSFVPGTPQTTTNPAPSFFLIGPPANPPADFRDPFVSNTATPQGTVPNNVSVLRQTTSSMTYTAPFNAAPDERTNGLTILLRRLANPHLPPNPTYNPANPSAYNPYITVDYLDKVPVRDKNTAATAYAARSKRQPYAAFTRLSAFPATDPNSPVVDSSAAPPATAPQVYHKFGTYNTPGVQANGFQAPDWLVHLDRQVISPLELLNVSAYQPHQLTQQFVLWDRPAPVQAGDKFQHLVPWFDQNANPNQSYRLYRLFEFMDSNNRGAGWMTAGRHTGKININAIWDVQTLQALLDPQSSNHFPATDVQLIYDNMMKARSPDPLGGTNYLPGPVGTMPSPPYATANRPILPLTTGLGPAAGDTQNLRDGTNVTRGINSTLLQPQNPTGAPAGLRLFEATANNLNTTHPYQRYEMLTKIFNNTTTRSNVFAVWITIGFFDWDPVNKQIGAEIGRAEGRNVRHRLFAVIDRSNLLAFQTTTAASIPANAPTTGSNTYGLQPVQLNTTALNDANKTSVVINPNTGVSWMIASNQVTVGQPPTNMQPLVLVYDPGAVDANGNSLEETVVATPQLVQGSTPPQWALYAAFTKPHDLGANVLCRGNPGPWTRYDPRQDAGQWFPVNTTSKSQLPNGLYLPGVVLHYSIID